MMNVHNLITNNPHDFLNIYAPPTIELQYYQNHEVLKINIVYFYDFIKQNIIYILKYEKVQYNYKYKQFIRIIVLNIFTEDGVYKIFLPYTYEKSNIIIYHICDTLKFYRKVEEMSVTRF